MVESERYYHLIVESLKLLALDYPDQEKHFPSFVDVPFEILDTFEKAFVLLPQVLEADRVACKVVPSLLRIHNLIAGELCHPDFSTLEAVELCNSTKWDTIRKIAKECLNLMGEPCIEPERNSSGLYFKSSS